MKIFRILFIAILLAIFQGVYAQPLNVLTHYMYNQILYNPASAGMHQPQLNASVFSRAQWLAIKGAPTSIGFWADYRTKSKRMAFGLYSGGMGYSAYSNQEVQFNYAYYIDLSLKLRLSMGLRAGFSSTNFNPLGADGFQYWDREDAVIQASPFNYTGVKMGTGFQLNSRKSYIGFALPDLFLPSRVELTGDTAVGFFRKARNIVLQAGTRLRLNDNYNFKPSLGMFYHPFVGLRTDLNATIEIKDYFWFGLTYSTINAMSTQLGANVSSRVRFGYAFEFYVDNPSRYFFSHEINLMINLDNVFRKKEKIAK